MTYDEWARRHPRASAELQEMHNAAPWSAREDAERPEAWAQQQARLKAARQGALAWRNNVGATPAKERCACPKCGFAFEIKRQPIRYGLANDSAQLNSRIKSSDLILAIPRVVRPQDVGATIAQFGSLEVKRPGWHYTGKGQEPGQMAWLSLIQKIGGYAAFTTGEVTL